MSSFMERPEGDAIVYCEGAYRTPNGKTAHGLVRFTRRYRILSVIDSTCAPADAGEALGIETRGIPIVRDLSEALEFSRAREVQPTHFVMGIAPDGGRLGSQARADVEEAIGHGLNVDSGLHDYLSEDEGLSSLAEAQGVTLRDVRKPPPVRELHFFSGKIEDVGSLRIAILGTDSALGKRTTTTILTNHLEERGVRSVMIGTGQTSWMQGVRYGIVLDSLINDFVSGEIEHAVWRAWVEQAPEVILIEGQGSLLNPAYPGGFEILAAARPHGIVLQHAPGRKDYDGFPGYPIHPLPVQIRALELVSGTPVVAIALNHEGLSADELSSARRDIESETGLPTADVLAEAPDALGRAVLALQRKAVIR